MSVNTGTIPSWRLGAVIKKTCFFNLRSNWEYSNEARGCLERAEYYFNGCLDKGKEFTYQERGGSPVFRGFYTPEWSGDNEGVYTREKYKKDIKNIIDEIQKKLEKDGEWAQGDSNCRNNYSNISDCITINLPPDDPITGFADCSPNNDGSRLEPTDVFLPHWESNYFEVGYSTDDSCKSDELETCGSYCDISGSADGSGSCGKCIKTVGLSAFLTPPPPRLPKFIGSRNLYPHPESFVKSVFGINANLTTTLYFYLANSGTNQLYLIDYNDKDSCKECCAVQTEEKINNLAMLINAFASKINEINEKYKQHRNKCAQHFETLARQCRWGTSKFPPTLGNPDFRIDRVGFSNDFKISPPVDVGGIRG
jgi:hypothetical protein